MLKSEPDREIHNIGIFEIDQIQIMLTEIIFGKSHVFYTAYDCQFKL